jgi:hypothetical protein
MNEHEAETNHEGNGTTDFRISVISQLVALNKGQDEICNKLDKANGNIDELFKKAERGAIALKDHIIECPKTTIIETLRLRLEVLDKEIALGNHPGSREMVKRVEDLERSTTAQEENKKFSRFWLAILIPILSGAGGALLMYVIEAAKRFPPK